MIVNDWAKLALRCVQNTSLASVFLFRIGLGYDFFPFQFWYIDSVVAATALRCYWLQDKVYVSRRRQSIEQWKHKFEQKYWNGTVGSFSDETLRQKSKSFKNTYTYVYVCYVCRQQTNE